MSQVGTGGTGTGRASSGFHAAFIVPRFGVEVIGGAETGARELAEHLVATGCRVSAFTTCALDSRTWHDALPAGTVESNGVTIHRFPSGSRSPSFEKFSQVVLADPGSVPTSQADHWIDLQGPRCPEVLDAAGQSGADVLVLYPYLYWPTVHAVRRFGRRCVLHPATHDELPIRLPVFRDVFGSPGGLVFQNEAERRLTERLFPVTTARPQALIGLGIDDQPGEEAAARSRLGLGDRPYLLCLGRVDDLKGTGLLADWFAAYKKRRPGPLALVLMGPVHDLPPAHPDVLISGPVDEAVKWGALRGAEVLVSPSAYESLSLVVLEGWAAGRPALVNGACAPTRQHCELSGGGLWFDSYATFEGAVDLLLGWPELRERLGEAGLAYVDERYRWPALIGRYRRFLEEVAGRL